MAAVVTNASGIRAGRWLSWNWDPGLTGKYEGFTYITPWALCHGPGCENSSEAQPVGLGPAEQKGTGAVYRA